MNDVGKIFRNLMADCGFVHEKPKSMTAKKFHEFIIKPDVSSLFNKSDVSLYIRLYRSDNDEHSFPTEGQVEKVTVEFSADNLFLDFVMTNKKEQDENEKE